MAIADGAAGGRKPSEAGKNAKSVRERERESVSEFLPLALSICSAAYFFSLFV